MSMGMTIVKPEESWDLWWCTTPMDIKKAKNLKKYQVSHPKYQLVFNILP